MESRRGPLRVLGAAGGLEQIRFVTQDEVERRVRILRESPHHVVDGGWGVRGGIRHQPDVFPPLPPGDPIRAAPDEVRDVGVRRPPVARELGPDVARQHPDMVGGVEELFTRWPGEPDQHRARVLRSHRNPAGQVRSRGRVEGGVRERVEGKPHVLRRHRLPVLPASSRPKVEAPASPSRSAPIGPRAPAETRPCRSGRRRGRGRPGARTPGRRCPGRRFPPRVAAGDGSARPWRR